MKNIKELSKFIHKVKTEDEVFQLISELLTDSELSVLSKRWRILNMLNSGFTQREISKELGVSLCKVTRGSKILKDETSVIKQYLKGDNYDK